MGRRKRLKSSNPVESAVCDRFWLRNFYLDRLTELSISTIQWNNLPETCDARFLEMTEFLEGMCVFFQDEVLGFLTLQCMIGGQLDVYRIPMERTAYASNGYQKRVTPEDSVIIFNNYIHKNSVDVCMQFANRLANLDQVIDINVNGQKTPILITCEDTQRLTMKNLYMQYEGNTPVIYANKNLNPDGIKVLKTDATYLADKLYYLKMQIWNEALTYLGISNVTIQKKERLLTDEVARSQGGVLASRNSRLKMREQACEKINKMFNKNVSVEFLEDIVADVPTPEIRVGGDLEDE